ncbi:MAG: hypothetical protein EZS28_034175, partial [Streblomastix strix]
MLDFKVVNFTSQIKNHEADNICDREIKGWIPALQGESQHVTVEIELAPASIKEIVLRLADKQILPYIRVQIGKLRQNQDEKDYRSYDYESIWDGKNDKCTLHDKEEIEEDYDFVFIEQKFEAKFVRILLMDGFQSDVKQASQEIICFELNASQSQRIKYAKLNALLHRQCQLREFDDEIKDRQIPVSTSVQGLGVGQGTTNYLLMMKYLGIIFAIGSIACIALCILFIFFSSHSKSITDYFNIISFGNVVAGYWTKGINIMLF